VTFPAGRRYNIYMDTAINEALSGLNAFATRQAVTANNIANSISANFKPSETVMESVAGGGVTTSVKLSGEDSVDISKEAVDLLINKAGFDANLKTLEAGIQMEKETIDVVA